MIKCQLPPHSAGMPIPLPCPRLPPAKPRRHRTRHHRKLQPGLPPNTLHPRLCTNAFARVQGTLGTLYRVGVPSIPELSDLTFWRIRVSHLPENPDCKLRRGRMMEESVQLMEQAAAFVDESQADSARTISTTHHVVCHGYVRQS